MKKSVLSLPLAAMLVLAMTGWTVAADASVEIAVSVWISGASTAGAPWTEFESGATRICFAGNWQTTSYRCAFEFSLAGIPANATVTAATLGLTTKLSAGSVGANPFCDYPPGCPIDLGGYAGDGVAALTDLGAGTKVLTFTPTSLNFETHDVTSFVRGLRDADAGWAGFNLSGTGTNDRLLWFMPEWLWYPPVLAISYATPTPSASPSPPGPNASVALITQPPTDRRPDPTVGGAASLPVLIVLLATVAVVGLAVRPRHRREDA